MSKLEVGQKVFLKAVGNNARYDKEVRIEEYEVKKVGRKLLDVWKNQDDRYSIKFDMENENREVSKYSPNWKLYFSKQDIADEEESSKLTNEIKKIFDRYGKVELSLEQLRKIKEIINPSN